ncbi:MAG: BsuBI/PstI family type II restriction endonuclease [Actinomycetota bacterium]|nr:BsuBI/PstI family type II restriction endonuclease [Actinomycetota bacterium]
MSMPKEEVQRRLYAAYNTLLKKDRALLKLDANERSLTHKLAEHLQVEFPDWDVDCEYNRSEDAPKRLSVQTISTDDTDAHTVFPDIIVHHRNTKNNLVVIEAKKSSTSVGNADEEKLKAYIAEHHYQFAFAVVLPVASRASEANPSTDIVEVRA